MIEQMAEALRDVVRARAGVVEARVELGRRKRVLQGAVDAVFCLEGEGLFVGETNVVRTDGQVFIVQLDCEENKLVEVREPEYVFVGAAVQDELADYVEGGL